MHADRHARRPSSATGSVSLELERRIARTQDPVGSGRSSSALDNTQLLGIVDGMNTEQLPRPTEIKYDEIQFLDDATGHRAGYWFATFVQGMASAGNPAAQEMMESWANCFHQYNGRVVTDIPSRLRSMPGVLRK